MGPNVSWDSDRHETPLRKRKGPQCIAERHLPVRVPADVLVQIAKLFLKHVWKGRGPRIAETTL